MNGPVIVIGSGGHARVLIDALRLNGIEIKGISHLEDEADDPARFGLPVLGDRAVLESHPPDAVILVNGIGSTASTAKRRQVYERFVAKGYGFATVKHPSAIIAPDVKLADGVQVMAGAVLQSGTAIGANTIVNTRSGIDHDCRIGAHVHVAPGATFSGGVAVGDGTHIGAGAVVIQSITIGANCVVGAGTVVIRDITDGSKVLTPNSRTSIEERR